MNPQTKQMPTLLNKSDAMMHAAEVLDDMAMAVGLISMMGDAMKSLNPSEHPFGDETGREALARMRAIEKGIVDKDLQLAAMREAANEIRALANETKLVEARAAQRGITPPVRGGGNGVKAPGQ